MSGISAFMFMDYILLVALMGVFGVLAGLAHLLVLQNNFGKKSESNKNDHERETAKFISRAALLCLVGGLAHATMTLLGLFGEYPRSNTTLLCILILSEFLFAYVPLWSACSMIEKKLLQPWKLFMPSFYRRSTS